MCDKLQRQASAHALAIGIVRAGFAIYAAQNDHCRVIATI